MAGGPDGDGFIPKLRAVAAITGIVLLAFLVFADVFGRLLIDPSFHVDDFIIGSLVGLLGTLLGIESLVRLTRK